MSQPVTQIALFGALEITHHAAAPLRPPTQRVLALLGYLIAQHHVPQSRDKLVDLLWPDLPPRQGRRMLSDTLWRARRLLTPPEREDTSAFVVGGDSVTFRPDDSIWVDLIAFEQLLDGAPAANPEQIRAAIELYRGDFLEDCYDDWALYERERLRERYLSALRALLAYDHERRAYDQMLQVALRLVRADPLREEGHRALMRAYYLLGREADALRAYEQCRAALHDELGVEPEPATHSLYEEIQALLHRRSGAPQSAGVPAPRFAISSNLPFVGRQQARAELMDAIEQAQVGAGGLLLLAGLAGQGKSRLLREVGSGAEWRGAQVSWGHGREDAQALPLGPLREALAGALTPARARQAAELVPPQTLGALLPLLPELSDLLPHLSFPAPPASQHQALALYTALSSLLGALGQIVPHVLLLEDLHWFDTATLDALAAIAPALRDARVLIVLSGRADEIQQRQVVWNTLLQFDRAGLLRRVELRGLSADECADLVRRALRMQHPVPRFSARLAETTGGNPFFILETLRVLYEQGKLTRDAQGGWHTAWDGPGSDYRELELPAELHLAIDERLRDLPATERATLAAAAVLGQDFTPTTLARMANHSAPPPELLRRQFLVEGGSGYRFGHELLREVIYSELDEPTRRQLHLRAAEALEHEHYARVEALAQHLYLAGAWEKAIPHLRQAGDHARAVGAYRAGLRNYDQALDAALNSGAQDSGPLTLCEIQLRRAELATLLGEYTNAILAYEAVLQLADRDQQTPESSTRAGMRSSVQIQALNGLCFVGGLTNDYQLAQRASRRAMSLAAGSPRLLERAEIYYQAGVVCLRRDDYAEAWRLLERALELFESLGDAAGQARCWYRMAWTILRIEGATNQAVELLERARATYRQQGAQYEEHDCTIALGNVLLYRGNLPESIRLLEHSLPFFRTSAARDKVSEAQIARAEALRRIGRYDEALAAVEEVYQTHVELGRTAAAQYASIVLGNVLRGMGRSGEAERWLLAACASDERLIRARALFGLTELRLQQGQVAQAFGQIAEALETVRAIQAQAQLGIALRLLGEVRAADGCALLPAATEALPTAEACFKESIRLLEGAQYESELSLTYAGYGAYLLATARIAEARAALIQAQLLAQQCGLATLLISIQAALQCAIGASAGHMPAPGQQRVRLARQGTPRGRPLRADEYAEVLWTIASPEDDERRARGGKVALRQMRLRRLCAEAMAQGAEPTVDDLAAALGVNGRTVDRDIAALRAAGEMIATRGAA